MRKKWNKRVLAAVMAAAMILGTSTTAFANASPPEGQEAAQEQSASAGENGQTENVPADAATETPQTEPVLEEDGTGGTAFTTPGNAQVQDDITEDGSKEFLTITTKNNNTFYLVIDRSASTENVYLLSQIDENDLQEFLKDGAASVSEKQERLLCWKKNPRQERLRKPLRKKSWPLRRSQKRKFPAILLD